MIIDSHQHFWNYEPKKHEWIDDSMALIRKDFTPNDLKLVYKENNIDGCVAVQADQTLEETDFLIDLASKNNFIKGIVGWVDLRAENIEDVLEKYRKPKIEKVSDILFKEKRILIFCYVQISLEEFLY